MTDRVWKRWLDSELVRAAVVGVAAAYMRLCHATSRWEVVRGDVPESFWAARRPFVLGFWHGRLLMLCFVWRGGIPVRVLVSRHRDGELIARALVRFGIGTVRGSSREGEGAAALREVVRRVRDGTSVCISPDGPRGPRMRAGAGIVQVARLAGVPVVPVSVGVTRRRLLSSWDRFLLPLPFARGVFVWGDPIEVSRDADADELARVQVRIEAALNAVTAEADRRTGHAPVEPAPAPEALVAPDAAG